MNRLREDVLHALEKRLGYAFCNTGLLDIALTHSSYVKGENRSSEHNERLEFLGDAVLELCVTELLYSGYPDLDEGLMTRVRAHVVCEAALSPVARTFELGEALLLSHGEERTGGREKPSILSDALESVIGAVFLDGGIDAARKLILSFVSDAIDEAAQSAKNKATFSKDYKTFLQECVQKGHLGTLKYTLVREAGPDHKKRFTMQALLDERVIGEGIGRSKQEAGQEAAKRAIERLEE